MMRTKEDRKEFNEFEEIAKRYDCKLEIMRKFLESRVKINCREYAVLKIIFLLSRSILEVF